MSRETDREVGLCAGCRHATVQASARGHAFWRCRLADEDSRFLRYPPLPVSECVGFDAATPTASSRSGRAPGEEPS